VNWLHFDGEDHLYALFFQGPPLQENAFLRLFAKYFFCQTLNALHFEDQCDQRLLNPVCVNHMHVCLATPFSKFIWYVRPQDCCN
jgi:hypothetical protein